MPDAILERSSPTTSDMTSDTASDLRYSSIFPPLIFDKCFLMQLISPMLAPHFSNKLVVACFSFKVIPSGMATRDEEPPDIKNITRSSELVLPRNLTIIFAATRLLLFGSG